MNSSPWAEPSDLLGRRAARADGAGGGGKEVGARRRAAARQAAAAIWSTRRRRSFSSPGSLIRKKFPSNLPLSPQPAVPFSHVPPSFGFRLRRFECRRCEGLRSVFFAASSFSSFEFSLIWFISEAGFFAAGLPCALPLSPLVRSRACRRLQLRASSVFVAASASPPPAAAELDDFDAAAVTGLSCCRCGRCGRSGSRRRSPGPGSRRPRSAPRWRSICCSSRQTGSGAGAGPRRRAPPGVAFIDSMKTTASMKGRRGSPRRWPQLRQ